MLVVTGSEAPKHAVVAEAQKGAVQQGAGQREPAGQPELALVVRSEPMAWVAVLVAEPAGATARGGQRAVAPGEHSVERWPWAGARMQVPQAREQLELQPAEAAWRG